MHRFLSLPSFTRSFTSLPNNYYKLFGIAESFSVNDQQLSASYKQLQRQWHPDKFALKPQSQKTAAATMSATLNEAYLVLRTPYLRAKHLLQIRQPHRHTDDLSVELDPDFLMWVVQFRDKVANAANQPQTISTLHQEADLHTQQCIDSLNDAFESGDHETAALQTAKLQYLRRIEQAISDISE